MRSGGDRSTALRNRNLERYQGARANVRFRGREHVGKLAKHITELCDDRGGPARVMQVKRDLPQVGRQSSQTRKNEECWSEFNRLSSVGEGAVTAVPASDPRRIPTKLRIRHRC